MVAVTTQTNLSLKTLSNRSKVVVVIALFTVVGVAGLLVGGQNSKQSKHFSEWPKTQGRVVGYKQQQLVSANRRTHTLNVPIVQYSVKGKTYKTLGTNADFNDPSGSSSGRLKVAYNPKDPAEAVVKPKKEWASYLPIISYCFLGIAGVLLLVLVTRQRSTQNG